jgi:hypothetical protein
MTVPSLPAHSSAVAVVEFGKEASQSRDCCVAENATFRAARPDSSLRNERLLRNDNQSCTTPRSVVQ